METKINEHILQELIDACWSLIDKNEISGSKLPCLDTCQYALYEFKNCYLQNVSGCGLLVLNKDLAGHTAGEVKSKAEWMQIIGRKGDIDLKYKSDAKWFSHYR
jgi:hypothetical protein